MQSYRHAFESSLAFSKEQGFPPDSTTSQISVPVLKRATVEIARAMPQVLEKLDEMGRDPVQEFGAQCTNTHLAVLRFLQQNYPSLSPNLTIGEFGFQSETFYGFSRDTFTHWRSEPPEITDCHVWITVGSEAIIDCTGLTYLQTRVHLLNQLGGVVNGKPGELDTTPIPSSDYPQSSVETRGLRYVPVAVGLAALCAIAPKFRGDT